MKIQATCQFCRIPITLTIDDEYAALGDPLKLVPLAACNKCADAKTAMRRAEDSIKRLCQSLSQARGKRIAETADQIRQPLLRSTKKFAAAWANFNRSMAEVWDEALADEMLRKPEDWWKILTHFKGRALAEFQRTRPTRATHPDP